MTEKMALNGGSNWEAIAFLVINKMLGGDNRVFLRKQLMSAENLDSAVKFAITYGHKQNQEKPEQTLQKTIQKLRDKGFMAFLRRGEYKLTPTGHEKMLNVVSKKCGIV